MIAFPGVTDPTQLKRLNDIVAAEVGAALAPVTWREDEAGATWRMHESFFPPWTALQYPDRCARVLPELHLMAQDAYAHEPSMLHGHVLYELLRELDESLREELADARPDGDTTILKAVEARLKGVRDARDYVLPLAGAVAIELEVADLFRNGTPPKAEVDKTLASYGDLLPNDIRVRLEALR